MIEILRTIVGDPPAGMEWLEYTVAAIVFLVVFGFIADTITAIRKFIA